jgi:hypothetical protein
MVLTMPHGVGMLTMTGRVGMILPEIGVDHGRQRAVQVPRVTPGGIILPVAA